MTAPSRRPRPELPSPRRRSRGRAARVRNGRGCSVPMGKDRERRPMADYDYVIVGAGSAGCALANRLSEDPGTRVLLLEAGGSDRNLNIRIPVGFAKQFRTDLDWGYSSEPDANLIGRSMYLPRGRCLGGSSSMNAMIYMRGPRENYDTWASQLGAPGWGY